MLRDLIELLRKSLVEMKRDGVAFVTLHSGAFDSLRASVAAQMQITNYELRITNYNTTPAAVDSPAAPPEALGYSPSASDLPDAPDSIRNSSFVIRNSDHPNIPDSPAAPSSPPLPPPPSLTLPEDGDKASRLDWLRERVLTCPTCNAHKHPGKKLVFGVGNPDATIFFCGEAPGADEETLGEPFVGRAGELLTKIITAMGLSRQQVYIGNIMKWRPEMPTEYGNRPPTREEMDFCLPYLRAQIAIVQPRVIVALGGTAIEGLLGPAPNRSIGKIHGQWHEFQNIPLMPTYHPAYLLRNNTNRSKRLVWEDMLRVMEHLQMPVSDRQRGYFL
jgi:DNA polymerase